MQRNEYENCPELRLLITSSTTRNVVRRHPVSLPVLHRCLRTGVVEIFKREVFVFAPLDDSINVVIDHQTTSLRISRSVVVISTRSLRLRAARRITPTACCQDAKARTSGSNKRFWRGGTSSCSPSFHAVGCLEFVVFESRIG